MAPQARGLKDGKTEISVKMTEEETGNDWLWDRNKFINRKSIMKVSVEGEISENDSGDRK